MPATVNLIQISVDFLRRCAAVVALQVALCLTIAGCTANLGPLVVTDPDASVKIPAMKKAVEEHDKTAIPAIVQALNSDDGAVRMVAIDSLQKLTGQDLGYHFYDDEEQRKPALARWNQWLKHGKAPEMVNLAQP